MSRSSLSVSPVVRHQDSYLHGKFELSSDHISIFLVLWREAALQVHMESGNEEKA